MIISDKHKYLFIETPHTGSTAISKELVENYDGKRILNKHANYHEFLAIAAPEQKKYFVFAGVRNPLDEASSLYHKFLNNHKGNYTDPKKLIENGGWVSRRKVEIYKIVQETKSFDAFFEAFYTHVYTSNIDVNKKYCDYIMRFEMIGKEFSNVLAELGIKKKRNLPKVNKTKARASHDTYFKSRKIKRRAEMLFGPFMLKWGYKMPNGKKPQPTFFYKLNYFTSSRLRSVYSKLVKTGPLSGGLKKVRSKLE